MNPRQRKGTSHRVQLATTLERNEPEVNPRQRRGTARRAVPSPWGRLRLGFAEVEGAARAAPIVEAAGVEPASESPLRLLLRACSVI